MSGRILPSRQPFPDLRAFVPDGRWEAIAWVGDRPPVSQAPQRRPRRPRRPDLSSFVHDGRTDAIAWAWDEPGLLSGGSLPEVVGGPRQPDRRRSVGNEATPVGLPELEEPELPPIGGGGPQIREWCPPSFPPWACRSFERLDPCEHSVPGPLDRPDGPFDPPEPAVASKDDRECQRAVEDIRANESDCPPPPIIADPCDRCSNIISYAPSPSLILETASNLFAPPTVVTQDEVDLVNAAWNFLQQNSDIVEWLGCLLHGPNKGRCLAERLFDIQDPQIITFDSEPPLFYGGFAMWTGYLSEHIHINTTTRWWSGLDRGSYGDVEGVVEEFDDARSFSLGDTSNLVCVVAEVASVILHEMLHGCLNAITEAQDNPENCDTTYMLGNAFMWAVGKRFPCILDSGRCEDFASDEAWMADT